MKIFPSKIVRSVEQQIISQNLISSLELMNRAAEIATRYIISLVSRSQNIVVICGPGNNGADGLVVAKKLHDLGFTCTVTFLDFSSHQSPEFIHHFNLLKEGTEIEITTAINEESVNLDGKDVIVDAIFGSGLNRSPEGQYAGVILSINQADAKRISIDIPSGMFADSPTNGLAIHAHNVISFEYPKLTFFHHESWTFCNSWTFESIGLNRFPHLFPKAENFIIHRRDVGAVLTSTRRPFSHKGTYGHLYVFSGSFGMAGAGVLCTKAAMRSGLGLCSILGINDNRQIFQQSIPSAMFIDLDRSSEKSNECRLVGPGIGKSKRSLNLLTKILTNCQMPMVIDADALNLIASHWDDLSILIPKDSILTPHPKEFDRLFGSSKDSFERLEKQKHFSQKLGVYIVLKGRYTSITTPNQDVYFNIIGNPGMATAGSGDVLSGILGSLMVQGIEPLAVALSGVYIHAKAGDLASEYLGERAINAEDIINFIPDAWKSVTDE